MTQPWPTVRLGEVLRNAGEQSVLTVLFRWLVQTKPRTRS